MCDMIFSGVLERQPRLTLTIVEFEPAWAPSVHPPLIFIECFLAKSSLSETFRYRAGASISLASILAVASEPRYLNEGGHYVDVHAA